MTKILGIRNGLDHWLNQTQLVKRVRTLKRKKRPAQQNQTFISSTKHSSQINIQKYSIYKNKKDNKIVDNKL